MTTTVHLHNKLQRTMRTGAEEKLCLRHWKAACAGGDHEKETLEEVRAWRGAATELKFLMNFLQKLAKPRKRYTFLCDKGVGQSLMTCTFSRSIIICFSVIIYPRKDTERWNAHFSAFTNNWCARSLLKNFLIVWMREERSGEKSTQKQNYSACLLTHRCWGVS